jgi:hypothetical protein
MEEAVARSLHTQQRGRNKSQTDSRARAAARRHQQKRAAARRHQQKRAAVRRGSAHSKNKMIMICMLRVGEGSIYSLG